MLGERDNGRCCSCAFRVLNDMRGLALHGRDARVGRTQVNTDNQTRQEGVLVWKQGEQQPTGAAAMTLVIANLGRILPNVLTKVPISVEVVPLFAHPSDRKSVV